MPQDQIVTTKDIPCCPEITKEQCCDRLRFTYRLQNRSNDIPVEIIVTAELERCPGPLSLGDVVYSTTLLPGEKVRLYTSNRNNRFTYDSQSEVTYRHEQASEETYYMSSMDRFMSDLSVAEQQSGSSSSDSEFETEGSVSNWTSAIFGRPNVRAGGSFSASSTFDFMRELSSHAQSSHQRTVAGTRAASSIAIGEVQSRSHAEGEFESAYEASTRTFENRNQCHSVTYFAYQLMKRQTVRLRIVSIRRRVIDSAADTTVETRPLRPAAQVAVIPNGILATAGDRLGVETAGRTSALAKQVGTVGAIGGAGGFGVGIGTVGLASAVLTAPPRLQVPPLAAEQRAAALAQVDKELVAAGVLDRAGADEAGKALKAEVEFEVTTCLPTQAILIKSCLDDCNSCEPSRRRSIELDLARQDLENKLLAKQIDLLEKSQEYRCCPCDKADETDETEDA